MPDAYLIISIWRKVYKKNKMKTQVLDNRIFNLAANLFDSNRFEIPAVEKRKEAAAKIAHNLAVLPDTNGVLMAVYPAIVDDAFAQSMNNYRKFVALKNFTAKAENETIKTYNSNVILLRKNGLSDVQTEYSRLFIKNNKQLEPVEYNKMVDTFSADYGNIVQKKKLITIKPTAELIFQNFLFLYNQQLMKKNERYMSCRITESTPLDSFKINSWKVTQLKRNDIKSLDLCPKTIRNHRQRFQDFGVLVEYHFAGTNRAVEVRINPEILVVKDLFNSKIIVTENQSVKEEIGKIVPNDNESITRTIIKDEETKENASDFQNIRSGHLPASFNFSFTRTPEKQREGQTGGAAAETFVPQNNSQKLQNLIIDPQLLFDKLAAHEFNAYRPIDIRVLYNEANNGTLSDYEFHDLFIQEFCKETQKNIYQNATVYKGSWAQAYFLIKRSHGIRFTKNPFSKSDLVDLWGQYRWQLQWARNWFTKNYKITPLFPNQYFDTTRKTNKEVGFEYTKAKYKEHQIVMKNFDANRKKLEKAAVLRKETINHSKKCKLAINRFFKNKCTLTELYDYFQNNLPKQFIEKLPEMIAKKEVENNEKDKFTINLY
jgi:hypothetical protein